VYNRSNSSKRCAGVWRAAGNVAACKVAVRPQEIQLLPSEIGREAEGEVVRQCGEAARPV